MRKRRKRNIVYVPVDIILNFTNKKLDPPKTEYEKNRVAFDENAVEKLVGGNYGIKNDK